jgi:type II secretion system protein C
MTICIKSESGSAFLRFLKNHMAKAKLNKKNSTRAAQSVDARIVELSLLNPEFGAKRLLPLLKSEGIDLSASTVYNILKRNGLQTRAKRLAKLQEKTAKTTAVSKKKTKRSYQKPAAEAKKKNSIVTDEVAEHIVRVSLQNPGFGARRLLALLEKDDIQVAASTVYRILKRSGLQKRDKRVAGIQSQQAAETAPPEDTGTFPPKPVAVRPAVAQPKPPQRIVTEKVSAPRPLPPVKAHEKTKFLNPWYLTLSNVLLLGLLVYSGFYAAQNFRNAGMVSTVLAAPSTAPEGIAALSQPAAPPLDDYRIIWERNLFNLPKEEAPAPGKEMAIAKLAPADQDLGLKLVGTVVADDPRLRRAFIDNSRTRAQEAFREGDTAGPARIKRILRNRVVITTASGDQLLTLDFEASGKGRKTPLQTSQPATGTTPSPPGGTDSEKPEVGIIEARLKRAQVESGLSQDDHLMQQVRVFPYTDAQGAPQGGFRLSYLMAGNVLVQMGLRSGDVILGVNGDAVAGPDDAAGFFEKLAQGGDITIQALRRGRPVQIRLAID